MNIINNYFACVMKKVV